jgi:hypothetical protein
MCVAPWGRGQTRLPTLAHWANVCFLLHLTLARKSAIGHSGEFRTRVLNVHTVRIDPP